MKNYTESLMEAYKEPVIKDLDEFLDKCADLIVANKGRLKYPDLYKNIWGTDYGFFVLWSFAAIAVTKHIPLGDGLTLKERPATQAPWSTLVFLYTRRDEDAMIEYSKTDKAKKAGLSALKRHDPDDDNTLHPGAGSKLADFEAIDNPQKIYEMKAGKDSPSSFHDANMLIRPTIGGQGYSVYKLSNPGQAILQNVCAPLIGFIPYGRPFTEFNWLTKEDEKYIIKEIANTLELLDKKLTEKSFSWPE